MKTVQVSRQFYPAVGGIETAIWHLSYHLQSAGHEVQVLTLNRLFGKERHLLPPEEMINGIRVRRIPYWGPRQYAIAPSVLCHTGEYDLVHLHSCDFFLDYLAWTKPMHRKPIVLSSHGVYFHTAFARTFKRVYFHTMTRMSLRQVSAIVCVSHHDFQLLSRIAPPERLYLIPNGIEYEQLSALDTNNRDPDLLLSVGRLAPNKRYDRLLRAFAFVVKRHRTARLAIIGPDQGLLPTLKELSVELDIAKRVEIIGQVSDGELLNYLGRANVWLSASSYEAFGIALLEAMAAGCLAVVHPLPSFRRLLTQNVEGYWADFDKPDQAAEVILKSLSLPLEDRERIVARARAKASRYSWKFVVKQLQEVYEKAMGSNRVGNE